MEAKAIRVLLRLVEGALARLLFFCVGLRGYVVIGVVGVSEQMSSLSHAFFFAPCKICRVALITMRSWCVLPLSLFDGVGVGRLVDWIATTLDALEGCLSTLCGTRWSLNNRGVVDITTSSWLMRPRCDDNCWLQLRGGGGG